jgi:hypothetical protein
MADQPHPEKESAMAKAKVAGRRAAAQQISLTPLAQASLDAQALYCDLDGIKLA